MFEISSLFSFYEKLFIKYKGHHISLPKVVFAYFNTRFKYLWHKKRNDNFFFSGRAKQKGQEIIIYYKPYYKFNVR